MISSPLFCPVCGAANTTQAKQCFACGQSLHEPPDALVSSNSSHLLKQRYRTLNRLGQGGMGSVYKAEDTELGNRLVAVKEMSQKGLNQHEATEATDGFKREALLLAGLMHPNLPRIYDHFSEAGRWYLVMDFIEGETLEDYLSHTDKGTLPLEEVLAIGIQLCTVLDYLHTRQPSIIFRDLKPANVLRTPEGQLYLIDFGIARHFKPGQARDTIAFGSPGYAAPEQYGKAQTGPGADIYSLGSMLHQMITGEDPSLKPFFFMPVSTGPAALQNLLTQMLDMDANRRPASAALVKQELQDIAQQDSLSSTNRPQPNQASPITVKNASIGSMISIYTQHTDWISTLAWSPNGKHIVSGSYDKTVQVWNPNTCTLFHLYNGHSKLWQPGRIHGITWSPDSTLIASASDDKTIQIWHAATGQTIRTYREHNDKVLAVAWSPNGKFIASANGFTTLVWNPDTGNTTINYGGHTKEVQTVAWSPNSRYLATGGRDNRVEVYDTNRWKMDILSRINYSGHTDFVQSVAWSPDGTRIASASNDKTVQVWDAETGRHILTYYGHYDAVKAVAWSPDGTRIASAGVDGTVQIWDALTEAAIFTYKGHFSTVYAIAWSPDGARIASGDAHNAVQVWRAV